MFRTFYVFIACFLLGVVLACSGDDSSEEEQPVVVPTDSVVTPTQIIFFDDSLPQRYELSTNQLFFQIPIKRSGDSTKQIRVPLKVERSMNAQVSMLTDVWFDAYATEAMIRVTYNPSQLVYDKYDTVTVTIDSPDYVLPNRRSSYTFTAGIHWHDHTLSCRYEGRFTDLENNDYARLSFHLGNEVTLVRYDVSLANRDSASIVEALKEGKRANAREVTQSGTIEIPMEHEPGEYAIVAVGFEDAKPVAVCRQEFSFISSEEVKERWVVVAYGVYSYKVQALDDQSGSPYKGNRSSTLYRSSRNPRRMKILPWASPDSDGLLFMTGDNNVLTVEGADTGQSYVWEGEDFGHMYFSDLVTLEPENYKTYQSTFDPVTDTYNFYGSYWFGAEYWLGPVLETFHVTRRVTESRQTIVFP